MSPTFEEKVKKASQKNAGQECPECGSEIELIKHIKSNENGKSLKFKSNIVKVCDCNKDEIYK